MLNFHKAELADASMIATLVNSAYRGESSRAGWTTEADILDGARVSTADIAAIIKDSLNASSPKFIIIGEKNDAIIGTICCEKNEKYAHLGMIAVKPSAQNKGFGKALIQAAETIALREWRVTGFEMDVISIRSELIAFYERLGYERTGAFKEFPVNTELWQPKVKDLKLARLLKLVNTQ